MKYDILFAFLHNFSCTIRGVTFICGIVAPVILIICLAEAYGEEEEKKARERFKLLWALVPLALLSVVPTLEDLTKIRIEMIKYQLVSPENVTKTTDEIKRIAEKLECKYLGCKEEKK